MEEILSGLQIYKKNKSMDTTDPTSFDTIDPTSIDTTGPTTTLDANITDTTTTIATQTDLPIWERIQIEITKASPLDPAADTTVLVKTLDGIEYYEDLKIYDFDFPIDDPIPGVSLYFASSTCPETPPKPRSAMSLLDKSQSFETPDFDMVFDDKSQMSPTTSTPILPPLLTTVRGTPVQPLFIFLSFPFHLFTHIYYFFLSRLNRPL
ncbi:hypothetical protein H0H93_008066 [Arthromyces matolae]|nr:hypothetical protein H0H93_008066 [Arthromyces matolae]